MIKKLPIRGHKNKVYYASKGDNSGDSIFELKMEVYDTDKSKVIRREVFKLSGSQIIAIAPDSDLSTGKTSSTK